MSTTKGSVMDAATVGATVAEGAAVVGTKAAAGGAAALSFLSTPAGLAALTVVGLGKMTMEARAVKAAGGVAKAASYGLVDKRDIGLIEVGSSLLGRVQIGAHIIDSEGKVTGYSALRVSRAIDPEKYFAKQAKKAEAKSAAKESATEETDVSEVVKVALSAINSMSEADRKAYLDSLPEGIRSLIQAQL